MSNRQPRSRPGAPPGNLNALKTGLYSKQFAAIGRIFADDPRIRDALMDINRRLELKRRRSQDVAALLFTALFEHARTMAGGELNLDLPVDDLDSIRKAASRLSGIAYENQTPTENSSENNPELRMAAKNQLVTPPATPAHPYPQCTTTPAARPEH